MQAICPPLVQHVEEPVVDDGVDVYFAALRDAAAGLVFNECYGGRKRGEEGQCGPLSGTGQTIGKHLLSVKRMN